jgi:hypothetical protein
MRNIYYHPEEFGLEVVAKIDDRWACYSFDLTVVWRDIATGKKYWASDSGCSCPSPFEDFQSVDSLAPLDSDGDWDRLNKHLMDQSREKYPLSDINKFMVAAQGEN